MSLSTLLLAVFLILLGITWIGWVIISTLFLGIWALITGIVILVDGFSPINIWKRK